MYKLRKLPKKDLYRVYNDKTKEIHSYGTTLENAKKQITLLNMVDAGVKISGKGCCLDDCECIVVGGSIQNPTLLELFKGTGSVGKQAKRMGFKVTSLDLEPHYTPDIETDILDWDYKKWANENNYVPDMIWASPPCNTFSPLVYRLKERDPKTAKPFSERAKLGTKVLYKTLEIIDYFKSKNPKLLFVIENPRGMMRMDAKMMKLAKETTLYCIYGDFKKKPTDFFNNFPDGLGLKVDTQCPKGSKTFPLEKLTLEQRYSIPSKLIKKILEEFKSQYGKKVSLGKGIELDTFKDEKINPIVSLPKFNSVDLVLPTYMYKPNPNKQSGYKWRLVVPTTKSRNLAKRKNEGLSVDISRKPVEKVMNMVEDPKEVVRLLDFPPADQQKIRDYYANVEANIGKDPEKMPTEITQNKPRGFPAVLYKNAIKQGLTKDETTTTYRTNIQKGVKPKKQPKQPKKPVKVVSSTSPQPKDDSDPKYQATLTREDTIREPKETDKELTTEDLDILFDKDNNLIDSKEERDKINSLKRQVEKARKFIRDEKKSLKPNELQPIIDEVTNLYEERKKYVPVIQDLINKMPTYVKAILRENNKLLVEELTKKIEDMLEKVKEGKRVSTKIVGAIFKDEIKPLQKYFKSLEDKKMKKKVEEVLYPLYNELRDETNKLLREEKKAKKSISNVPELEPIPDLDDDWLNDESIGKGIKNIISTKNKKMNSWVQYVKDFASKKGIKYNEALKDPECKAGYKKLKGGSLEESRGFLQQVKTRADRAAKIQKVGLGKCGCGIVDEGAAKGYADQVLIATAYNQSNLGADNAGRKFISL